MIDDFQHVSITCRDLERSVCFYESLGLKVINRIEEVKEDGIAHAFQLPRALQCPTHEMRSGLAPHGSKLDTAHL